MKKSFLISFLIPFLASTAILSQLSPQVRYYLGPFYPIIFAISFIFIIGILFYTNSFLRAINKNRIILFLSTIFILQALLRFSNQLNQITILSNFIVYPILIILIIVTVSFLAVLDSKISKKFQDFIFYTWLLSLILGIPTLLQNPLVARAITSGGGMEINDSYYFSSLGAGGFSTYAAFSIVFPILWLRTYNFTRLQKALARILLIIASFSVFLSGFSFASLVLLFGQSSIIIKEVFWGKKKFRILIIVFSILVVLIVFPNLFDVFFNTRANNIFEFVWGKTNNTFQNFISTENIIYSDQTNRIFWFVQELQVFLKSPLIGIYSSDSTFNLPIYFHSSFSNFLVVFGLPFAFIWFIIIYIFLKKEYVNYEERFILIITFISFFIFGLLNPIWNNPVVFTAIITFIVLPNKKHDLVTNDEIENKNS